MTADLFTAQHFTAKPVYVMGICNVTPDSFSDGGKFALADAAIAHARAMLAQGADIIDIGGESTRPGAVPLDPVAEQDRIIPVIEALRGCGALLSVDTRNPSTMREALGAGAVMLNDITALTNPRALKVALETTGPVCLMHMQGKPLTMQDNPVYDDVVEDIFLWLQSRIAACVAAGIDRARIVADPGFGFGKTFDHNMSLLDRFERFRDLGVPLLAGLSRKAFIGTLMGGVPPEQRVQGSVDAAMRAVAKGARILRVHDVAPTVEALRKLDFS